MTITYVVKKGLYINLTNRCSNACEFCIRQNGDGVYGSDSLWLEREPELDEVMKAVSAYDLSQFEEVVFCGYGEPTERADLMIAVARAIKSIAPIHIRINTNGHGNLIAGRDITPEFEGIIDTVSISLNTASSKDYVKVCHPEFGEKAYEALIEFAGLCKRYVDNVILSVVDTTIPPSDIEECARIAEGVGVTLRVRPFE